MNFRRGQIVSIFLAIMLSCSNQSLSIWQGAMPNMFASMNFIVTISKGKIECRLVTNAKPFAQKLLFNEAHGKLTIRFNDSTETQVDLREMASREERFSRTVMGNDSVMEYRLAPISFLGKQGKISSVKNDVKFILTKDSTTFSLHSHLYLTCSKQGSKYKIICIIQFIRKLSCAFVAMVELGPEGSNYIFAPRYWMLYICFIITFIQNSKNNTLQRSKLRNYDEYSIYCAKRIIPLCQLYPFRGEFLCLCLKGGY